MAVQPPIPNPALRPTHLRALRTALISVIAAAALATPVAAMLAHIAATGAASIFHENGPVEIAQLVLWIGAGIFAVTLAVPQRLLSDKSALALVALAAFGAAAREVDAHVLLNPETIGDYGVRYRIDWWLDGSVSIIRKAVWAAFFGGCFAAVVVALRAAKFRPLMALKQRSRVVLFFAIAGGCLLIGFVFDDLLRNRIPLRIAQASEESIELFAPIFYIAATNALAVAGLAGDRSARNTQD